MSFLDIPTLEDLHNVLCAEAEAYRRLVDLTQRERSALQAGKLTEVEATTREKEAIVESLAQQEEKRELIVAHLAKELRLPTSASLLELVSALTKRLPSFSSASSDLRGAPGREHSILQELKSLHQEFVSLVEQLLMLNQGNRSVIRAELARVNATFDYLARTFTSPNEQYTSNGKDHSQPTAGGVLNWQI
jgi:flagellar biosynthesis/type III secretory pathway chaperone